MNDMDDELVREARELAKQIGKWPAACKMEKETGINKNTFYAAINGRSWKHVK